jgi:hypothetical protein
MIIQKNTVNTCVFSLAEKTTLTAVYYLFEFTNSQDDTILTFTATDISINKLRYNEFEIEETTNEDRLTGKITLDLLGSYTYKIYEQSSATNLEVANAGGLVEIGRIDVKGTVAEDETFTETRTIAVFND